MLILSSNAGVVMSEEELYWMLLVSQANVPLIYSVL